MAHAFEDIEVKENALELLEQALKQKRKRCMIGTGAMTDPYLPIEEKLRMTRGALELIDKYGFGATVLTKSTLVLRDLDLLARAVKSVRDAGVPTVVWLCPILPFLNDTPENIALILASCADAGVKGVLCFNMGLTLREGNREYFYAQLDRLFPGLKERYIRTYGNQYVINSPRNEELMRLFHETCEKAGMLHHVEEIFPYLHTFEEAQPALQLSLFDIP